MTETSQPRPAEEANVSTTEHQLYAVQEDGCVVTRCQEGDQGRCDYVAFVEPLSADVFVTMQTEHDADVAAIEAAS